MYPSGSGLTHPIDALQLTRWQNLLTDASQSGGQVVPLYDTTPIDYPFMPSLVLNPSSKALVTTQEIFGPILPIICYDSMSEAIDWINHLPTPLALYWFGNNAKLRAEVLEKTQSGGVTCNDTLLHYSNPNIPFGGLGASGMGSNHGKHGFDTFSHLKPVLSMRGFLGIRALGGTRLAHPPYGKRIQSLMKILKTSKI
jgi:coniferyl-aldehyde dehydrogenase